MSEVDKFLDSYESPKTSGQKPAAPAAKPASEVDSLMETAPPQDKGFLGHARDLGLSAVKSAIAVPETLVGLADIPTRGRVGKFLENEGGALGFRPKQAKEFLSEFNTDAYKDQQRQFQEADGILDKTAVALQNPSLIANTVTESIAPMLAGGVAARGLLAGTRLGQMGAKGAAAAGAIGEGAMMAGAQASSIRQETDDGLLTPAQSGAAVATGLAGTLFGYLGGRVAQRFGFGDIDTMLARGANPQSVASEIASLPAKSIPRQVIEGAITEGFLEELPQSISEQIIQNLALGKPWSEGVEDAAVMGTLAGVAMGGGASLYSGMTRPEAPAGEVPPPATGAEPPAGPQGFVPTTERPIIDEAALGRAGVFPPAPAPIINERALEPAATPSQQMGLDPAAGPMSAAAALAVDTGASAAMQQAAQAVDPETGEILEAGAKVPEQKQATDTPEQMRARLGFIEQQARANGGWDRRTIEERDRLQAELAKVEPIAEPPAVEAVEPAPAIDVSGRTDDQLRVLEQSGRDGWREAAVAEIQRRAAQQPAEAPAPAIEPAARAAVEQQAPATSIKDVLAKQIPDMTDGELQQAIDHYGPSNKRTVKLLKEVQKRGQGAPAAAVQPTQAPTAPEQSRPAPSPRRESAPQLEAVQPAASEGWDGMTAEQRAAILTKPGGWATAKGGLNVIGKKLAGQSWTKINPTTRATIERLMQGAPDVQPAQVDAASGQGSGADSAGSAGVAPGRPIDLGRVDRPARTPAPGSRARVPVGTTGAQQSAGVEGATDTAPPAAQPAAPQGAQPANVPPTEQVATQAQEARGQEGEKAKWIKATVDKSRLNGSSGIQLAVTPNGGVTFLGDPNTSKDGKALLANYEKALAAGATQQEIAAALQVQTPAPSQRSEPTPPQAQQVEPAPGQDRRPMPSGLSFPSERIVTNVQGEFEALEVQASSIGTSDGYVNFGSQYPDGRYYIESAGKSIGFANGQWGDVTPEGLKPRGTYDPDNLQAETIRVLEGEGAKRSKAAAPEQSPADAARPNEGATTQPATPEFTTLKDRNGKTVTVRTADLSSARERMPMFTKDGKRKTTWIHRDNLDPNGEKQAEGAKEMAGNPLFNVITTKDGGAFAIKAAASRELNARGLAETHEVVPAGDVQAGMKGYLVRKKADTPADTKPAEPAQQQEKAADTQAAAERTEYPFGEVPTNQESKFFRSRVRVLPEMRGDTAWDGEVGSILNGGRLLEVTRDGRDFSVRVRGERIEVLERVENGIKESEVKSDASVNDRWSSIVAATNEESVAQRSVQALARFAGATGEPVNDVWVRWRDFIGATELAGRTGEQVVRWMESNLISEPWNDRAIPGNDVNGSMGSTPDYWRSKLADYERAMTAFNEADARMDQQTFDVERVDGSSERTKAAREILSGMRKKAAENGEYIRKKVQEAEKNEAEETARAEEDRLSRFKPFDAGLASKKPSVASITGWFAGTWSNGANTAWSDGSIADLYGEPHLKGWETRKDNKRTTPDVDRVIPRNSNDPLEPVGMYDGKVGQTKGVMYYQMGDNVLPFALHYVQYFMSKYKGAKLVGNLSTPTGPAAVVHEGRTVGVIMPMRVNQVTAEELRENIAKGEKITQRREKADPTAQEGIEQPAAEAPAQPPQPETAEQGDVPADAESIPDDLLTPDQARALMTWEDLGQRDNVKSMRLAFFENAEDMAAKRGAMNYGTIESYQGGKWNIDGTTYPTLKAAKAAAEEAALVRLANDGYVAQPFAAYDAVARTYGYEVRADGAIGSEGKFPGPTIKEKGGRLRVESSKGDLLGSYPAAPESLGRFLERFWGAEKQVAQPAAEQPASDRDQSTVEQSASPAADDFPLQEAQASYSGISHSGTSRGKADADEFQAYIDAARDAGLAVAATDTQKAAVEQATAELRAGYLQQYRRLMSVRSGTYSGYVAGRSGLNSKQADKRNSAYDRAIDTFVTWQKANQDNPRKAAMAARTPEQIQADQQAAESARQEKEDRKESRDRKLMERILSWKKGGEPVAITKIANLAGVNYGKDGYPTSIKLAPTDGSTLTDDKFDLAALFREKGMSVPDSRRRVRELVDAVRVELAADGEASLSAQHEALMASVRTGKATPEAFKASFEQVVANEAAIKAELSAKTKAELLREGGPYLEMRYANEKKDGVVDAVYRQMIGEYALGEAVTYGMARDSYQKAVRRMVEATDADKLAQYVRDREAAIQEAEVRRTARAEAMANPQTLNDYRSLMNAHIREGKTRHEAFLMLTPEQRIRYDELEAEGTREAREARKRAAQNEVRAAGQTTGGQIIATQHTRDGHDLFVVQLAERLSREDYNTVLAGAKRLGGRYSAFRGNGAVPGFQFRTREDAEAFLKLAGGDVAAAKDQVEQRRDAFADDRSQTAAERLAEMADRMERDANAEESRDRKANTARRARFASAALNAAAGQKAMARTMRNISKAIQEGRAKFLDAVRTRTQVDALLGYVRTAKDKELRAKYPSYADQEKRKGEPATAETAGFADFPSYTAFRSDLAMLGRQMLEIDGTKKLGQKLMSVADDVTDAYLEFARDNIRAVSQFGRGDALAEFANRESAERAIRQSGLVGKAIVLPIKRGQNRVILSPSEAMSRKVWAGDGDKRITLSGEFGKELVEAIGRRGNKTNGLAVPWQFQNAYDRRKLLSRIGIETPSEFRSALREVIALQETAVANKVREMELAMVGRRADGLDFFPTPAEIADQMVEAADIAPDMAVLEPSAGMGHIADRIREAGAEPDVIEISADRRELLEEKGYHLAEVNDFLNMEPRKFFTYGDIFRAPDGVQGVMRGAGHMGSQRVRLEDEQGNRLGLYNRDEVVGVAHRGSWSGYDRIIMNPPFSDRRDAEHVQHAYTLLRPGGRIVAIMGEGVFFGQDKRAQDFRDWLDAVGGTSEKLPEGSFMDPSLPVQTGVNARMVVIDRPAEDDGARQPGDSDADAAFSATLPRDRNAVRIGITEKGLVRAMRIQFDGLADITGKLLERGRAGKRGGVIVIGTADNAEIGRIVAERTGRKLDATMRKFSSAGRINGFYDPKTGLTFLVGPNLNPVTATAVMLHEMMHGQQRQQIDARALEMVRNRHSLKDEKQRAFLDRVMLRMIGAGEMGNAAEASAYIVEQAVIEGRSAGYAFADNAFMQWVDATLGKRVGDFLRSFAGMIRTWMLRNGLGAKTMTVDDFVGYAMAGLDRAVAGEVRGRANARASIEESDQADGDGLSFSRSGVRALASRATTELNQTLTAPGKLSWWHKTIGTMYNLAERSPAFKPVFQAAQGFIDDVSHYAADAAERAPKLLPRLDTWRDILKSPISAEDNKAVGKPIFEGTLSWTRDAEGRPVRVDALTEAAAGMTVEEMVSEMVRRGAIEERTLRMWRGLPEAQFDSAIRTRYENSFLQPGIVWTDDELASMFSLTPAQITLYREFRAAVDRSLDTMARADMLRFAGEDVRFLRDPVMEAETLREAASLIVMNLNEQANVQPDRAEQFMATSQGVMDRMEKVLELQATGYAPLSRFGKYTVDVVVDGNREYFGLFETAREANKMAERMRAEFGAGTVTQGTLSDEAFRLFAGITPESLELFGNMLGLESTGNEAQDRAFQEYLRLTKTNRSALRRLIHRKGIAGFSEDVSRVLASFAYSNARQTAAGLHMGDLSKAVSDIPKEQGELKDVAVKLAEYIKNPQEEAQALRGLLFAQYLGGSVASAFVNMTQPAAVTFPWLSQHGGAALAAKEISKAAKHIATRGHRYEEGLAEALKAAEEDGVVSPQEVHQLMAQARGSGSLRAGDGTRTGNAMALASNSVTRLSAAWGKLFSAAEQLNRRITFIAAYRVASQQRMANPAEFARRAVTETQFVYSKASKMQWGRGAVGGTLMTFKTYSVAYMELMSRLWSQGAPGSAERKSGRKAVALMLAMVLLMGGGGGLPFMEDAEDLIDGIAQIAGYNVSTKKARQQFLIDTFGADAADFIERGVSGLPGVPLDVSGRLGLGNLIPGTGLFLDRSNNTRDILELLGPVGDLGSRIVTGARKAVSGDIGGALLEVSPVAVRNVAKGVDMAATDQYRDYRGYKVLDTTDLEAALKAIGFQPAGVAKVQDANYLNQRAKDFYSLSAQRIRSKWAEGIYEKDSDKVQEARDMIAQWNADNPDQPMIIRMPDILRRVREMGKDKAQRIADTAPRAMRQQLREELMRQ